MENYNIYDEIGRGTHSFVYKARRKRSIEYVAVKSTAKSRMDKILNEVPFLHKLDSRYVLKFFDWYESSNHIWLILEYCMGGDLLNLITQDKQLPESVIKSFGIELVAGLQYLHANSILYCDLKPANVLIDEFGSLKLADFGLARRIPGSDAAPTRPLAPGSPHYMAPELFQQTAVHSFASDFWALGCVLYELRTGRQPFTHTNYSELARMVRIRAMKIQTEVVELPVPRCEMSLEFCNLLERLLVKDPYQRIPWNELVDHPFWDSLPRLGNVLMPPQEIFDRDSPVSLNNHCSSSDDSADESEESLPDNEDDGHHTDRDENENGDNDGVPDVSANGVHQPPASESEAATTNNNCDDGEAVFLDSGPSDSDAATRRNVTQNATYDEIRPVSAPILRAHGLPNNNEDFDGEIQDDLCDAIGQLADIRHRWRTANAPHSAPPAIRHAPRQRIHLSSLFDRSGVPGSWLRKISKLIFTAADCRVKSIIGNKDIKLDDLPRVHAELLRFALITPEDLLSCTTEELENQLKEIYVSLKSSRADDQAKLSTMAYLFSLSCHTRLAHVIVNSSILKLLIRMLAQEARLATSDKTMLSMLCLVLGVLFRFATFIAPSSPDQLRLLVKTLLEVVGNRPSRLEDVGVTGRIGLQSRSLALACLGELLFFISTQQEWELPMEGVEVVLACIEDPDIGVRYYAVRTLSNMLIHCTDSLLPKLMSDKIVLTLIRGLLRCATPGFDEQDGQNEQMMLVALRTTTTEALAQVLRHLRTPSSSANLPSRLKRSITLFFAKPDILNAVWRGVDSMRESTDLTIASLNVINAFLDMKLGSDREAEFAAIKASRTLLLERIVALSTIQKILEMDSTTGGGDVDGESLAIVRAKSLIMLHLGIQLNRDFLTSFVQNDALALVEQILALIADQLCADENNSGSQSPEKKLSAFEMYLTQCALNVCKLVIRMALQLGADCFSAHGNGEDEGTSNNNAEHLSRISPMPFQLFSGLLQNPNCRQQLLTYFVASDSKQFTFFLRLMAKLLTSFPDEILTVQGEPETKVTVARSVSEILLGLFQFAAIEANDIVLVEKQELFTHLLPAVVKHVNGESGRNRERVAVNCLQILHVVLLDFDYDANNGEYQFYDPFIRSVLLPHLSNTLSRRDAMIENIWSLSSELLFGLLSSDSSLLSEAEDLKLVSTVTGLLCVPTKFKALPSNATQLVQVLMDSAGVDSDLLYKSGIARSIVAGLMFAEKRKVLDGNLVDLVAILLNLLHQQFERMRQPGLAPAPPGFDDLIACGSLLLQFCAYGGGIEQTLNGQPEGVSPENDTNAHRTTRELANLSSRCLVFLSQIFGEQLNEEIFSQSKTSPSESDSSVLSLILTCLQTNGMDDDDIVVLRVLLTLKNCLRCQGNNGRVSHWMAGNARCLNTVKALASQRQPSRTDEAHDGAEGQPNRPSIGEQISKTAAAIVRLCRISYPR